MNFLLPKQTNLSATLILPESCNIKFEDRPICPICKKSPLCPVKLSIDRGIGNFYDKDTKDHVSKRRIIIEMTVWLCELSCDVKELVNIKLTNS